MSEINTVIYLLYEMVHKIGTDYSAVLWLLPLIIFFEIPLLFLIITGLLKYRYMQVFKNPEELNLYTPKVSCIVTCYSEGDDIKSTVKSLVNQIYDGHIEIILVVDGAVQNQDTYHAALYAEKHLARPGREVIVLPKWQRGGRVSSCNAGLDRASGEIVMALDGDTSFDNTMVSRIAPHFQDPNVPATSGALRVRNNRASLFARFQSIEYLLSMQGTKTGLSQWRMQTNISGAFGAFRRSVLKQIGGWSTHSAEDLDLTIRLKQYQKRHPNWYVPFEPTAIGHTDVPHKLGDLIKQRLRWDGDLFFIFFRKHWQSFSPGLVGYKDYLFTLIYGWGQNVVLPFVIAGYSIFLFVNLPFQVVLMIFSGTYIIYTIALVFFYIFVVIALSERIKEDLSVMPFLVIYPFYAFFMRYVAVVALLNEIFRRSHEESAMAPWWVFKKGGKF